MSFGNRSTQQKFPFKYGVVFDGLVAIVPKVGFTLKSKDKTIGRITASAPLSLFSWGESVVIVAERIDNDNTLVAIESTLKAALPIFGSHRHVKNFETLIAALSSHLQSMQKASAAHALS